MTISLIVRAQAPRIDGCDYYLLRQERATRTCASAQKYERAAEYSATVVIFGVVPFVIRQAAPDSLESSWRLRGTWHYGGGSFQQDDPAGTRAAVKMLSITSVFASA